MRKVCALLGITTGLAFAHIKPFEHPHIGIFHPEDILFIGVLAALVTISIMLGFRLKKS